MKQTEMIVLGLAAVAVYMIYKAKTGGAGSVSPSSPLDKTMRWTEQSTSQFRENLWGNELASQPDFWV